MLKNYNKAQIKDESKHLLHAAIEHSKSELHKKHVISS